MHHRRVLADDGHGNRTVEVDQTGSWRFLMFRGSFTVRMIVEQRRADRMVRSECLWRCRRQQRQLNGRRAAMRAAPSVLFARDSMPCRTVSRLPCLSLKPSRLRHPTPATPHPTLQIHFRLARSGFMRDFSGTWVVRPFDNTSLDQLVNRHNPTPLHRLQASRGRHKAWRGGAVAGPAWQPSPASRLHVGDSRAAVPVAACTHGLFNSTPLLQSGLRAVEQTLGLAGQQQESLVQLQQSIAPALAPPAAVTRLLQRIAAKQVRGSCLAGLHPCNTSLPGLHACTAGVGARGPALLPLPMWHLLLTSACHLWLYADHQDHDRLASGGAAHQ